MNPAALVVAAGLAGLSSLAPAAAVPPIEAVVHYGTPELAGERDRRTWTQHLNDTVNKLRKA